MPVAVLVHGGFHGGWCWRKVRRRLTADGWDVYTPSLTGMGEHAHLLTPEIGLETHVQDIIGILETEELYDVVLCGHSAGGIVVTAVADRLPDRIGHLVCLDATVPESGQSLMDVLGDAQGVPAVFRQQAAEAGDAGGSRPRCSTPPPSVSKTPLTRHGCGAACAATPCARLRKPRSSPAA